MKACPQCNNMIDDQAEFCPACGAQFAAVQQPAQPAAPGVPYTAAQPPYAAPAPAFDPYDHTAEFDAQDISENKVIAMVAYLIPVLGVIIALIAAANSKYAAFHVRQALKLTVVSTLVALCSAVLCWTFIVPIAGGVCSVIVFVLQIIAFFQVCGGKAKEPAIIRSLGFLK